MEDKQFYHMSINVGVAAGKEEDGDGGSGPAAENKT